MNTFVFPFGATYCPPNQFSQPMLGQLLIPIDGSCCGMTQSFMILNYNQPSSSFTCVSNMDHSNHISLPMNQITNTLLDDLNTCHNTDHNTNQPQEVSSKLEEETLYPLTLHQECDKLYLNYIKSCHSSSQEAITESIEEDSLHRDSSTNDHESTKSIDKIFSLSLDCEELTSTHILVSNSVMDMTRNESDGKWLFCPFSNDLISVYTTETNGVLTELNTLESITPSTCSDNNVHVKSSTRVSNNSKNKRQRPLSMQQHSSDHNKKVKSNMLNGAITWHHMSIDSNMNQQENTFIYENSSNMFENFSLSTPNPTTFISSKPSPKPSSTSITTEFSSIIIETPESISKKVKRGRPKKDFQIE